MAFSRDEEWMNIPSQEGVWQEDRCCALLANHSTVQAALESLPDESADSGSTERAASKAKKRKERKPYRKDPDDVSGSSGKENRDSGKKHSSLISSDSTSKSFVVCEEDGLAESLCQAKTSKREKISAEDYFSGQEKVERKCSKKKKPPGIKENVIIINEKSVEEMTEQQAEVENAGFQSTEKTVGKAKKRKKKRSKEEENKDFMYNKLFKVTDCSKGKVDDSGGSEKENCNTRQKSLVSFLGGTAPKRFNKDCQTKPRKRKKSVIGDQLGEDESEEEHTKKRQCLMKEAVPRKNNNVVEIRTELQDSLPCELRERMQFLEDEEEKYLNKKKRKPSVSDLNDALTKRICKGIHNKGSKLRDLIKKKSKQKSVAYKANLYKLDLLIRLMYQLDLSLLCWIRKSVNELRYPSLTLAFGDPEIAKFGDIVIRYKGKSVHICIENVDSFVPSTIGYSRLFTGAGCSLNSYFRSFVKHWVSTSDALRNVEYLVIFTTAGLDLTQEKELRHTQSKKFYPFRFRTLNGDDHFIVKNFLHVRDVQNCGFYQFSKNKKTREELFDRLKLSPSVLKSMEEDFPEGFEKEVKKAFLDKLVFAVNQPNREQLNCTVRKEMKQSERDLKYLKLQKKILSKLGKHIRNVFELMFEFNLLMLFSHDILHQKQLLSVKFEGENGNLSDGVIINYKGRVSYLRTLYADRNIDYCRLFSFENRNVFSVDYLFTLFVKRIEMGIRYFIVYTNAGLDLTEENELKKGESKAFYPFKFGLLDIEKKKYKVLRRLSCMNGNDVYQFSKEEQTRKKLLSLLKISPSSQEAKGLSDEKELKEQFLDKLIFVVNQPDWKMLNQIIRNETDDQSDVPYDCGELCEIALRWLESYEIGPIRKEILEKLLKDVKSSRSSYLEVNVTDMKEEIKFAKGVVGNDSSLVFYQLLHYLLRGEGRQCLEVLRREGIKISNLSTILHASGSLSIQAFKNLYDFWFDEKGNKTHYLKTLEKGGINILLIARILHNSRYHAVEALKDLYDLWFDQDGEKTKFLKNLEDSGVNLVVISRILKGAGSGASGASKAFKDLSKLWLNKKGTTPCFKTLEREGINLSQISGILRGAEADAPQAFKDLYDVWFDEQGNKRECLKTIKKEGISLSNLTGVLQRSGTHAAQAFKDLYDLWFDDQGSKKYCLNTLEQEGIKLPNLSHILSGAGKYGAESFINFFNLLFDEYGNKKHCLRTLEKEGIKLSWVSGILSRAGTNAHKGFKDLYNLWFDRKGKKTVYLKNLEKEGIELSKIASILGGAGISAAKAFKELYYEWFDEQGSKKQCVETLNEKGLSLSNVSGILLRTRTRSALTFKGLYSLWFDEKGKRTRYLKKLEDTGINLTTISSILKGTGILAPKLFKELYDLWFDKQGNKTQCVVNLEKRGVDLIEVSNVLRTAGNNAPKVFIGLHDLWFDKEGKRTQCMKNLRKEGVNLSIVFGILDGAGSCALKTFKDLYDQWFDKEGEATPCLKSLKENNLKLSEVGSILCGAGRYAAKAFKALYNLWFSKKGERTYYVTDFVKVGGLSNVIGIFYGAGAKARLSFKSLHGLWFDERGNKTRCLEALEKKRVEASELSVILSGAGARAAKAFKDLYNVLFDRNERRSKCFKNLGKEGIKVSTVVSILRGAGANAPQTLKDLYCLWFDEDGSKTRLVQTLEENGIGLFDVSGVLIGAGSHAPEAFRELWDLWFDEQGNKTKYVTELEEHGMDISDVPRILEGAGSNAAEAFKDFYGSYFDKDN